MESVRLLALLTAQRARVGHNGRQGNMTQYIGMVVDCMTGEIIYRSRPTSWGDAQARAERKAKGDRYAVQVVEA